MSINGTLSLCSMVLTLFLKVLSHTLSSVRTLASNIESMLKRPSTVILGSAVVLMVTGVLVL